MAAGDTQLSRAGPIVLLTYAHAGGELLREAMSACPSLACTSGTGVLPMCHEALTTWKAVEGRNSPGASALAVRSVRALAATMVAVIQAGSGAARWCESATAAPEAAESFLQVFPSALFVCLHRSLPGLLAEGLRVYSWGLGGSPFWPYAAPHPGNNIATIAAYWAARTEPLLAFEARHHHSSIRVRYEDLTRDTGTTARAVCEFLGLEPPELLAHHPPQAPAGTGAETELALPVGRLPDGLRAKIAELHDKLGYPPLDATGMVLVDRELRSLARSYARPAHVGPGVSIH